MVVRIAHPHDFPVRVRLDAVGIAGSEERFYQEADKSMAKTMALFWPITSDQAPVSIRRLELVSLNGFKREAEQRRFHIRLGGLGQPVPADARPPATDSGRVEQNLTIEEAPDIAPIPARSEGR